MSKYSFSDYQEDAYETALKQSRNIPYLTLGLVGEAGEVANKIKKTLRGDGFLDIDAVMDELGDILWYVACLCEICDRDMTDVAGRNILKLRDRQNRGVIQGDGDDR